MEDNQYSYIKPVEWILTLRAKNAIQTLVDLGFNKDIALALLETVWPEQSIYMEAR